MPYIIIGLMICCFSLGMLQTPELKLWGGIGFIAGGLLIFKGRRNSDLDKDE